MNVNNSCWRQTIAFISDVLFAAAGPHSIIIMREAQLDKVYNGGFKCHGAGPDISLFDMESEMGAAEFTGRTNLNFRNNKFEPVTKARGKGWCGPDGDIYTQQCRACPPLRAV